MTLLERESALADLTATWHDAIAGRGRAVLISGEAGIGKTSLVRSFLDGLPRSRSARRWVGMCDPWATPPPLGPWLEMAHRDPTLADTLATSDPQVLAPRLAHLLEELTLVVVEDAHWMDDATADVLTYLTRRIERTRALLLVTHREEQDCLGEPARHFLGVAAGSAGVTTLPLRPLSRAAVAHLARDSDVDVDDLLRRTSGVPLYVSELLTAPGETVPSSIGAAVADRVARLPRATRNVVDLAALTPEGLEANIAETVLGTTAHGGIDGAVASGLLVLADGLLHFRHEVIRLAAADAVPAGRTVTLQRALIVALEDLPVREPARLAHHVRQVGDHARMRRYGPAAATDALRRGANAAAVDHLETTLALGEALPADERAQHLDTLTMALQDFPALVRATAAAADAWRRTGEPIKQARALARHAVARHNVLQLAEGREAIETAWDLVRDLPFDPDTAAILVGHLYWRCMCDHLDQRHPVLEVSDLDDAIARIDAVGAEDARGHALMIRGQIHARDGHVEASAADGEAAIATALVHDPNRAVVWASNLAEALVEVNAVADAGRFADRAVELGQERDLPARLAFAHLTRARVHVRTGAFAAAVLDLDHARELSTGHDIVQALGTALRAAVAVRHGHPDAAARLRACSPYLHVAELTYAWPIATAAAERTWLEGDHDGVETATAVTLEIGLAARHPWAVGEMLWWRSAAGLREDRVPAWVAAPWRLMLGGQWREAAAAWGEAPYEQALALAHGDLQDRMAALTILDRIGATPLADVVRAGLRSAGVRSLPTRPRTVGGELTDRQREILALLVDGLSNPEIAQRLHIAPKTAAHHVSAILSRLGASTRTEAAARAVRDGLLG